MAAIHNTLEAEGVLHREGRGYGGRVPVGYLSRKRSGAGLLCLTQQRLVWLRHPYWHRLVAGRSVHTFFQPSKIGWEIRLDEIQRVERTKWVLNDQVLTVTDGAGETHRLSTHHYHDWAEALSDAGVDDTRIGELTSEKAQGSIEGL